MKPVNIEILIDNLDSVIAELESSEHGMNDSSEYAKLDVTSNDAINLQAHLRILNKMIKSNE